MTICLLGAEDVSLLLKSLAKRKPSGKSFNIISDEYGNTSECQILYIDSSVSNIDRVMANIKDKQILTVSDIESFTARGGVVGFFLDQGKLKLEINLTNARELNINISSKLLELSRIVK
jgi:hypothetical protein